MSKKHSKIKKIAGIGLILFSMSLPIKAEEIAIKSAGTIKKTGIEQKIKDYDFSKNFFHAENQLRETNPLSLIKGKEINNQIQLGSSVLNIGYQTEGTKKAKINLETKTRRGFFGIEHQIKKTEENNNILKGYFKKNNFEFDIKTDKTAFAKYNLNLNNSQTIIGTAELEENQELKSTLKLINKKYLNFEVYAQLAKNPEKRAFNTLFKTSVFDINIGFKNNTYSAKIIRDSGRLSFIPVIEYNNDTRESVLNTRLKWIPSKNFSLELQNKIASGKKPDLSGEFSYEYKF